MRLISNQFYKEFLKLIPCNVIKKAFITQEVNDSNL